VTRLAKVAALDSQRGRIVINQSFLGGFDDVL
jgi:hypothetical protein